MKCSVRLVAVIGTRVMISFGLVLVVYFVCVFLYITVPGWRQQQYSCITKISNNKIYRINKCNRYTIKEENTVMSYIMFVFGWLCVYVCLYGMWPIDRILKYLRFRLARPYHTSHMQTLSITVNLTLSF